MTTRQKSTTQAQGLLTKHPDLKVIVAPTTVGILAAAQVVSQAGKSDSRQGHRPRLPAPDGAFVKDGTSPEFGLWSVPDLGYLAYSVADQLVKGDHHRRRRRAVHRPDPERWPAVHD